MTILENKQHMTVGALIAIMWDPSKRGTFEHEADISSDIYPLLCGSEWKDNIAISQLLIQKDGSVRDEDKITCQGCIAVLKLNGL